VGREIENMEMWRGREMEIRRDMEMVDIDEEKGGCGEGDREYGNVEREGDGD
jgi:hypothetical protein